MKISKFILQLILLNSPSLISSLLIISPRFQRSIQKHDSSQRFTSLPLSSEVKGFRQPLIIIGIDLPSLTSHSDVNQLDRQNACANHHDDCRRASTYTSRWNPLSARKTKQRLRGVLYNGVSPTTLACAGCKLIKALDHDDPRHRGETVTVSGRVARGVLSRTVFSESLWGLEARNCCGGNAVAALRGPFLREGNGGSGFFYVETRTVYGVSYFMRILFLCDSWASFIYWSDLLVNYTLRKWWIQLLEIVLKVWQL